MDGAVAFLADWHDSDRNGNCHRLGILAAHSQFHREHVTEISLKSLLVRLELSSLRLRR